MDDGIRSGKSLSLGIPMAPQGKILRRLKRQSLGMPPSGIPSLFQQPSVCYLKLYFYSSHDMCLAWSVLFALNFLLSLLLDQSHISLLYTLALRKPRGF